MVLEAAAVVQQPDGAGPCRVIRSPIRTSFFTLYPAAMQRSTNSSSRV